MGKKSLTKSTTKKKAKKSVKKKTVEPTSSNTKSTLKSPLDRQFDGWAPKKPWKPAPDKAYDKNFASPPSVKTKGKAAAKIRSLLLMNLDIGTPAAKKTAIEKQALKKTTTGTETQPKALKQAGKTSDKPTKKPAVKETKPAKKATRSIKELISLKFDSWHPENPYASNTDGEYEKNFSAPPAFEGIDKSLLLKTFDLSVPDAPKPVKEKAPAEASADVPVKKPEKKAAKKEPVPVEQLLKMNFGSWQPEKPYVADTGGVYEQNFSAPPAFEGIDKPLLLKQFDLSIPDAPKAAESDVQTEPAAAPFEKTVDADTVKPASHETSEPEIENGTIQEAEASSTETPATQEAELPGPEPIETPAPAETKPAAAPFEKPVDADTVMPASHETAEPAIEKGTMAPEEKTSTPAAEESPPPEPPEPPEGSPDGGDDGGDDGMPPEPPKEPLLGTGTKILVAALGFIFFILIVSSYTNMQRYYMEDTRAGIEIWRGTFSPMDRTRIAVLAGAELPVEEQPYYSRNTAMTIAYEHFMGKTEELMKDDEKTADLRGIRTNLENAARFAITSRQQAETAVRLNQIDFAMLIYRADVAAEEQTRDGYQRALEYLNEAKGLDINSPERSVMLNSKIEHITNRLEALEPDEPEELSMPVEREEPLMPEESEEPSMPEESEDTGDSAE